jgi:hypothetical protein
VTAVQAVAAVIVLIPLFALLVGHLLDDLDRDDDKPHREI